MSKCNRVIVVGFHREERLSDFTARLAARGLQLAEFPTAQALPPVLRDECRSTLLVYNPPQGDQARQVLKVVADAGRRNPVIVLVDGGEFEEYYELMSQGAYDYFELSNGPEVIERSIRCAGARFSVVRASDSGRVELRTGADYHPWR